MLRGLMMEMPLLTSSLIRHGAAVHGDVEVVSRLAEGPMHRTTWGDIHARACQLAQALLAMGVKPGDRIATMAWNSHRHLELYHAISGIGAVLHTLNPRLFPDQLEYIVNHAEDRFLFLDLTFVELAEELAPRFPTLEGYIVLADADNMPEANLAGLTCYEDLIAGHNADFDWPEFDEWTAAALCYTSGTTGNPKGALYTHRSTVLHAMGTCLADHPLALSARQVVLPAVPMFHANGWGIPYGAPMSGTKLVLPGPYLDAESLYDLLETEKVTLTAGVPTVWSAMLDYLRETGKRLDHLKCLNVGGSAPPLSMIEAFEEDFGVPIVHAWGMTEMSPVGTSGRLKAKFADAGKDIRYDAQRSQSHALYPNQMKITDDDGNRLPHDGKAVGELHVRGPWVIGAYYNDETATADAFDSEGWFGTGDVASIDADGLVRLTDRAKDLIKSGGEWISSIELENAAMAHPGVAEAAAIAIPDEKWTERPLLAVVRQPGSDISGDEIRSFLAERVAKWWLPEQVVFVDEIPHTATGKISKKRLRAMYANGDLINGDR